MRFYIGSRHSRKGEMVDVADTLTQLGHEVKARWLEPDTLRWSEIENDVERFQAAQRVAIAAFEDITKANAVVIFSDEEGGKKGGVWTELGLAVALNKLTFLVGPRTNAFCHLPFVDHFDSVEEFYDYLSNNDFS